MKFLPIILLSLTVFVAKSQNDTSFNYDDLEYSDSSWTPLFDLQSDGPYGGRMLQTILDNTFQTDYLTTRLSYKLPSYQKNQVYFIYAYDMHMTLGDIIDLQAFVKNGNDAILMCEYPQLDLLGDLMWRDYAKTNTTVLPVSYDLNIPGSILYQLSYLIKSDQIEYPFRTIPLEHFYDHMEGDVEPFLKSETKTIGVKVKYGEGNFYLISTPMLFSNIHMKSPVMQKMIERFLLEFEGKKFYIDIFSDKLPDSFIVQKDFTTPEDGPLGYVMKNSALTWSYCTLLVAGLLYLVFTTRRKQKIIPLMDSDENSSMEFVRTVSNLYLSKKRHSNLIAQKKRVFMHFIRHRYFIPGNEATDEYKNQLLLKSGVDKELIDRIFNGFTRALAKMSTAEDLIELHNDIEAFHKKCK